MLEIAIALGVALLVAGGYVFIRSFGEFANTVQTEIRWIRQKLQDWGEE